MFLQTKGKFLTIEGSEGAGKSTNVDAICEVLDTHNIGFYHTREPGGTPMAEEIRDCLLAMREEEVTPMTELLMMFAARAQHIAGVILPRLQQGEWVVCDRFTDATYAYQGAARGMPTQRIAALEEWIQGPLQPDLTIFLDVPPEVGAQRIADRAQDRLEQENLDFFHAVRDGYLRRAEQNKRFRVIDASRELRKVTHDVADLVERYVLADRASSTPGPSS